MTAVFMTFLDISLVAALMICLTWAFRAVFSKRISPVIIAVLWLAVLLRLCVPFTIESPVHAGDLIDIPSLSVTSLPETNLMPVIDPAPVIPSGETEGVNGDGNYMNTGTADMPIAEPAPGSKTTRGAEPTFIEIGKWLRGVSLWNVLAVIWVAGAVGILFWTVCQALAFRRSIGEGREVTDSAVLDAVNLYKEKLGIKRSIRVRRCDCVDTPAIFGYFRPYLLLPIDMEVTGERLTHVLLHELCHIRRQDILLGYLWLIAKALHWFNPLVWIAYRLYRDDVELCCDGMVIRHLEAGEEYAYSQTLIDVVRSSRRNPLTAAASLCENKEKLKERVVRMLNPGKRSKIAVMVSIVLGLVILVGCFTTACRPKNGDVLTIDPSHEIVYSDEYVEGQDAQYWYGNDIECSMVDTGNGYYYMGGESNQYLCYMDKTTGESAPVCNKPGCEHRRDLNLPPDSRAECNAYMGETGVNALIYYGNNLYALGNGAGYALYMFSPIGDAPRELRKLTARERNVHGIAFHRGYIYYSDLYSGLTEEAQTQTANIYRLPVDDMDAEPELIYSIDEIQALFGHLLCYGNYVYFWEYYFTDEARDYSVRQIKRYDIRTGKIDTILDDNVGGQYTVLNGKLAYYAMDGTYLCDLDGKNQRRISDRNGVLSVGGGYLIIDNISEMHSDYNPKRTIYAYDGDGSYRGQVQLDDWKSYPWPVGVVDGLYLAPTFDDAAQMYTMYGMPVDKIADGTAVPEVFYQGEPTSLDITVSQ